jgi:hypothetical protein
MRADFFLLSVSFLLLTTPYNGAWAQPVMGDGLPRPGIDRPLREQRNLMYAAQDRLNALGYKAGGREAIWKRPFTDALRRFQTDRGLTQPNGDLDRDTVRALLGPDLADRR